MIKNFESPGVDMNNPEVAAVAPEVTFEAFREQWLADVREGSPSTTELGHRFARKLLTQWKDIDESSDSLLYCDGSGDGGIDIAHLDQGEDGDGEKSTEGHTWYLVQSKYGHAFQGSGTLQQEGQKVIDTLDGKRLNLSSLAAGLLERLTIFRDQALEHDRVVLVFATEVPLTDAQQDALRGVRAMGRDRLGAIFDVESVSIKTIYDRIGKPAAIRVPLAADLKESGTGLLVGPVSLLKLYDFLKTYRAQTQDLDQLYEKNVRRFLGSRGKVNKAIEATLRDTPERFGLYNNGITIVVQDYKHADGGAIELIDPYVVNGCQTTRTIWEVCYRLLEAGGSGISPKVQSWRELAEQGVVVTKIVKVSSSGDILLQDITRYTNSQNAVREKDFLALTSDFRTWAQQMAQRHNVYLEVQRGAWDSQKALQAQKPGIPQFKEHANAFDLLKVYGSGWLGEAGAAFGRNAAFLPNGTVFRRIINNETTDEPFNIEDLYAAYLLERAADEYKFGRGAPQMSRRQTRFLFYMVVMELLKDIVVRVTGTSTNKELTRNLLKLFQVGNETAVKTVLDVAIEVIDEYLRSTNPDSVFEEPHMKAGNSDLNSYLKWERLGKTEDSSPRFRTLLTMMKGLMGRSLGGQKSPRDIIVEALKS